VAEELAATKTVSGSDLEKYMNNWTTCCGRANGTQHLGEDLTPDSSACHY